MSVFDSLLATIEHPSFLSSLTALLVGEEQCKSADTCFSMQPSLMGADSERVRSADSLKDQTVVHRSSDCLFEANADLFASLLATIEHPTFLPSLTAQLVGERQIISAGTCFSMQHPLSIAPIRTAK